MRLRTSSSALPRSIRPRETRTSAHVCDAKERPCSRRRHGRGLRPAHLAEGHRHAPFRPRSPQSFSEDSAPHSVHVRTSTSIESSVSTLRLRTRVKRGLSRDRPVSPSPTHSSLRGPLALGNGSHLVALVRTDATFRAGVVESDRGTQGSPPARLAGPIQKFWGFLRSGSESTSSGGTSGEPSKASPLSLTANASLAEGRADLGTNRPVGACGEQPRGSSV